MLDGFLQIDHALLSDQNQSAPGPIAIDDHPDDDYDEDDESQRAEDMTAIPLPVVVTYHTRRGHSHAEQQPDHNFGRAILKGSQAHGLQIDHLIQRLHKQAGGYGAIILRAGGRCY